MDFNQLMAATANVGKNSNQHPINQTPQTFNYQPNTNMYELEKQLSGIQEDETEVYDDQD